MLENMKLKFRNDPETLDFFNLMQSDFIKFKGR